MGQGICYNGMSDKLGPITFGDREEMVFLGKEIGEQKNYSEAMAAIIDQEIARFITNALKTAQKIVKDRKIKLKQIADILMEKETLERKEFEKLMASA